VPVELRLHGRGRELVGQLQLDRLEADLCGGADTLDQRVFDEQVAEIGGKARHLALTAGIARLCTKREAETNAGAAAHLMVGYCPITSHFSNNCIVCAMANAFIFLKPIETAHRLGGMVCG